MNLGRDTGRVVKDSSAGHQRPSFASRGPGGVRGSGGGFVGQLNGLRAEGRTRGRQLGTVRPQAWYGRAGMGGRPSTSGEAEAAWERRSGALVRRGGR